jgi:hypothetical protein
MSDDTDSVSDVSTDTSTDTSSADNGTECTDLGGDSTNVENENLDDIKNDGEIDNGLKCDDLAEPENEPDEDITDVKSSEKDKEQDDGLGEQIDENKKDIEDIDPSEKEINSSEHDGETYDSLKCDDLAEPKNELDEDIEDVDPPEKEEKKDDGIAEQTDENKKDIEDANHAKNNDEKCDDLDKQTNELADGSYDLRELQQEYFDDLRNNSEYPDTISKDCFDEQWEKISPEQCAQKRSEFNKQKNSIIGDWEKENGMSWLKYDKDIYSSNDRLLRKQGDYYDAHHIRPLSFGGENSARNLTPLNAEVHYDRQGIHSQTSPYSRIENKLKG